MRTWENWTTWTTTATTNTPYQTPDVVWNPNTTFTWAPIPLYEVGETPERMTLFVDNFENEQNPITHIDATFVGVNTDFVEEMFNFAQYGVFKSRSGAKYFDFVKFTKEGDLIQDNYDM